MTKQAAQNKLEKEGYKVTRVINNGRYIATKKQRSYIANSLNGLITQIF